MHVYLSEVKPQTRWIWPQARSTSAFKSVTKSRQPRSPISTPSLQYCGVARLGCSSLGQSLVRHLQEMAWEGSGCGWNRSLSEAFAASNHHDIYALQLWTVARLVRAHRGPTGRSDRDWRSWMRGARPLNGVGAQLLNPTDASAKHCTFAAPQKEVAQPQTFPRNSRNQHNQYSTNSRSSVSGVSNSLR
jgi:hypothetical protein